MPIKALSQVKLITSFKNQLLPFQLYFMQLIFIYTNIYIYMNNRGLEINFVNVRSQFESLAQGMDGFRPKKTQYNEFLESGLEKLGFNELDNK